MTPNELLAAAERLLARRDAKTPGIWPRAAAFLGRQALEQGLDAYWRKRGIALDKTSMRPQLICLPRYLGDKALAGRAAHAWSSLTRACHHHPYELSPTQAELRSWLTAVGETLQALAHTGAEPQGQGAGAQ
jgi:hypothetical protein